MHIPQWCRPILIIPFVAWAVMAILFWTVTAYASEVNPNGIGTAWNTGDVVAAGAGCKTEDQVLVVIYADPKKPEQLAALQDLFDGTGTKCWTYMAPTPIILIEHVSDVVTPAGLELSIWSGQSTDEAIFLSVKKLEGPHSDEINLAPSAFSL